MLEKRVHQTALLLLAAALVNVSFGAALGLTQDIEGDGFYYLRLAQTIASGGGYVARDSHWPDSPTARSLPAWPFVVSVALRVLPGVAPSALLRALAFCINSLVAIGIFWLTHRLFSRSSVAVVAAIAYVLHPSGLVTAYHGLSEPLFLLLVTLGLLLLLRRDSVASMLSSAALLGTACLVRPNFLLFAAFLLPSLTLARSGSSRLLLTRSRRLSVMWVALFLVPLFIWTVRNYSVCDRFPVISTLRGHAFYGGNNPVVANSLTYWGYWVFPDEIPGERTMASLSQTMSECEVDEFYYRKGRHFVTENWFYMPRLWLGKLIRAYVPVPFNPTWQTYAASGYRWLILLGALLGIRRAWGRSSALYRYSVIALALTNLTTVLVFWGNYRFAWALEPFLLPFFAVGILSLRRPADPATPPISQQSSPSRNSLFCAGGSGAAG